MTLSTLYRPPIIQQSQKQYSTSTISSSNNIHNNINQNSHNINANNNDTIAQYIAQDQFDDEENNGNNATIAERNAVMNNVARYTEMARKAAQGNKKIEENYISNEYSNGQNTEERSCTGKETEIDNTALYINDYNDYNDIETTNMADIAEDMNTQMNTRDDIRNSRLSQLMQVDEPHNMHAAMLAQQQNYYEYPSEPTPISYYQADSNSSAATDDPTASRLPHRVNLQPDQQDQQNSFVEQRTLYANSEPLSGISPPLNISYEHCGNDRISALERYVSKLFQSKLEQQQVIEGMQKEIDRLNATAKVQRTEIAALKANFGKFDSTARVSLLKFILESIYPFKVCPPNDVIRFPKELTLPNGEVFVFPEEAKRLGEEIINHVREQLTPLLGKVKAPIKNRKKSHTA